MCGRLRLYNSTIANAQVSEVAAQLDSKIERLIDKARQMSR